MGMYDRVEVEEEVNLPEFPEEMSHDQMWQTKTFNTRDFTVYKITEDGKLLQEEWHMEETPKEERPYPEADPEEEPLKAFAGSMTKVVDGWTERKYHGMVNFYTHRVDDVEEWYEYKAKFTDGELENIKRINKGDN